MSKVVDKSIFDRGISWRMLLLLSLIASIQDASRFAVRAFSNFRPSQRSLYPTSFVETFRGPYLGSSSSSSSSRIPLHARTSSKVDAAGTSTKVLYQKVIRPPPSLPDILFLGYLVEYLESYFELPNGLPMIYETNKPKKEAQYIIEVDSPLSPASEVTRMEIEVVGIYTTSKDDKKDKNGNKSTSPSTPNMAMVVVKKKKDPQSSIPPMMENLFTDSEKRILKALDRGLEDFVQGKIRFREDVDVKDKKKIPNFRTAEQVIEAELMDEAPSSKSRSKTDPEDVVVEAYATLDDGDKDSQAKHKTQEKSKPKVHDKTTQGENTKKPETKSEKPVKTKAAKAKKGGSNSVAATIPTAGSEPAGLDFAVRAAKQAAAKRKARVAKQESPATEDYAVAAARKAAAIKSPPEDFAIAAARKAAAATGKKNTTTMLKVAKQKEASKTARTPVKGAARPQVIEEQAKPIAMPEVEDKSPPALSRDNLAQSRSFGYTISRPSERAKKGKTKTAAKKTASKVKKGSGSKVASASSADTPIAKSQGGSGVPSTAAVPTNSKAKPTAKTNAKPIPQEAETTEVADDKKMESKPMPSREQMELDVMKAAKEVIEEMVEDSEDMTAEELLRDVLKFDEEEKKSNEPGSGFVSGAFEKAKEIMQDRYRQRQRMDTKIFDGSKPNIADPNQFPVDADAPSSEEEELRRMFQAGEQIADTRITKSIKDNVDLGYGLGNSEDEVDQLIANEKSISNYAKVLDDELIELELQINPTPGEELDGPMKNPMFDVMSGPEVYNPNTDMDDVNYPGALPGTKELRLPKPLKEVKKQAEFATGVLKKLRTVETKDDNGSVGAKYFVGETEMTLKQLTDLQSVVSEASQIGIITDPVTLMKESSRLQLLVDELWNQPKERFREIAENYKDLILSDNFVSLVKERMQNMVERDLDAFRRDDESLKEPHAREREILGEVVVYAQLLLKEVRALGAELEAQQLEVVRSICKVAMDPRYTTEEETAMALTDAVRDMRPLLDDMFVAYLKYAVVEEKGRLARAGLLDDPEHNQWLFVLQIVQQGVYNEIAIGINRHIDHIGYVIRMKTPRQRRMLLEKLIDVMPSLDVRPFVQVVENIVGALGDGAKGEFDGIDTLGGWANELLQLHRDVKELLPPERIALKARDADEWAERQRQRLLDFRKVSRQRLQAANDNAHLQDEIEALGKRGEIERIE
ncbi:unnamed protein product [Cylindrotheca closterium]|uniref:Uncharacterized protein n=1 Tax=Cylindrotheca closterium TaxID=2856 RepID=A0AAD2GBX9_9STRA|nr:unnamed protein product [Cylindrotheca closterium]